MELLKEIELKEQQNLTDNNKYDYLYQSLDDPKFIVKIAEKKEFNDTEYDGKIENVELEAERLCNADFELANHQIFVRNFLSNQTPYNGLLLFHGLGTGKTCSAITISEEYREYMKQMGISKRIIIVGNKNIQDNYKLQLFDERKLELIDGIWILKGCTGNKFINEINPMNMKGMTRSKIVSQINTIINTSYLFLGYREFGNLIGKKINKFKSETNEKLKEKNIIKAIKNEFSNRLIIIDEVQNVRMTDNIEDKKVGQRLLELAKHAINVKLILLSATPMFNSYKEIIWLLNLLNQNDKRRLISINEIFDSKGNFKIDENGNEVGKEILIRKARGYISFVRGDNPYTFPYRIFPYFFSPKNSVKNVEYPTKQINGKILLQGIEHVDVYLVDIGTYQKEIYYKITEDIQKKYIDLTEDKLDKGLNYQLLEAPLQILNITYPNEDSDDIKDTYGKNGLENVVKFKRNHEDFEYASDYSGFFKIDNIGNYSSKIKSVCENILLSEGIVLVYSQYIDGGLVPMALALEELGFTRYGRSNLFKNATTEPIDSLTMLPKSKVPSDKFKNARYSIISGDVGLSPNNIKEIKKLTNLDNKDGSDIKVVLISRAGSEGIDLKNVRQIHIIDPWYNMNRIEQIIGRGVRTCSHKDMPFIKRNVMIFLYATYIDNKFETLDLYLYRLSEIKAVKIGAVSRVLKQTAIDCILNNAQTKLTTENINQTVKQNLSNKIVIDWSVGDKPYTALCDYMDTCTFDCIPNKETLNINYDTYNEDFIMLNTEKLVEKIKDIFKEQYVCSKDELIQKINYIRVYPLVQIYAALNRMLNDNTEILTDMFGKKGYLVNIGEYYLFQPVEIRNKHISIFERMTPIDFKHQKIIIELPPDVNNAVQYDDEEKPIEKNNLIKILYENFKLATTPNDSGRGDTNWFLLCSNTIDRLEANGIKRPLLEKYVVEHLLESLYFDDKLEILNYITNKTTLSDFETMVDEYFKNNFIKVKGITGYIFNKDGAIVPYILEENTWVKAKPKDIQDMGEMIISNNEIPKDRLANIVGFLLQFKNKEYVFKTIDTTSKNKGARCDQSGKSGVLNILNKIMGKNIYNKENTKGINVTQMCSEQELYLRFFNDTRREDKYWFLTPEQIILTKFEK